MKCAVILVCAAVFGLALASDSYTTKFDDVDLDQILNNQRVYNKYLLCFTNKGVCTPDAKEVKDILPDALATACSKCNEKQKKASEKIIRFMIKNKPNDYNQLEKLYDPQGVFKMKYKEEAKKFGIPV